MAMTGSVSRRFVNSRLRVGNQRALVAGKPLVQVPPNRELQFGQATLCSGHDLLATCAELCSLGARGASDHTQEHREIQQPIGKSISSDVQHLRSCERTG
jgi:hypothetical protein